MSIRHSRQYKVGEVEEFLRQSPNYDINVFDSIIAAHDATVPAFVAVRIADASDETSVTLHITMTSDSTGKGQLFWQEEKGAGLLAARRSQFFDVQHDGQQHEYSVNLNTKSPLLAVRIDPFRGKGKIQISHIRLTDRDRKVLYTWSF